MVQHSALRYTCYTITTHCNAECPFCYRIGNEPKDIDLNLFKKSLPILKGAGAHYITITGGEPLLHRNWEQFVIAIHEQEMRPILSTNGLLLNDLSNPVLGLLDTLTLPLDSNVPTQNDFWRGSGHFSHTKRLIHDYISGDYPFTLKVNTVVSKVNEDNLEVLGASLLNDRRIIWKLFELTLRGNFSNQRIKDYCLSSSKFYKIVNSLQTNQNIQCWIQWLSATEAESEYFIIDPDAFVCVANVATYESICSLFDNNLLSKLSATGRKGSIVLQPAFNKEIEL